MVSLPQTSSSILPHNRRMSSIVNGPTIQVRVPLITHLVLDRQEAAKRSAVLNVILGSQPTIPINKVARLLYVNVYIDPKTISTDDPLDDQDFDHVDVQEITSIHSSVVQDSETCDSSVGDSVAFENTNTTTTWPHLELEIANLWRLTPCEGQNISGILTRSQKPSHAQLWIQNQQDWVQFIEFRIIHHIRKAARKDPHFSTASPLSLDAIDVDIYLRDASDQPFQSSDDRPVEIDLQDDSKSSKSEHPIAGPDLETVPATETSEHAASVGSSFQSPSVLAAQPSCIDDPEQVAPTPELSSSAPTSSAAAPTERQPREISEIEGTINLISGLARNAFNFTKGISAQAQAMRDQHQRRFQQHCAQLTSSSDGTNRQLDEVEHHQDNQSTSEDQQQVDDESREIRQATQDTAQDEADEALPRFRTERQRFERDRLANHTGDSSSDLLSNITKLSGQLKDDLGDMTQLAQQVVNFFWPGTARGQPTHVQSQDQRHGVIENSSNSVSYDDSVNMVPVPASTSGSASPLPLAPVCGSSLNPTASSSSSSASVQGSVPNDTTPPLLIEGLYDSLAAMQTSSSQTTPHSSAEKGKMKEKDEEPDVSNSLEIAFEKMLTDMRSDCHADHEPEDTSSHQKQDQPTAYRPRKRRTRGTSPISKLGFSLNLLALFVTIFTLLAAPASAKIQHLCKCTCFSTNSTLVPLYSPIDSNKPCLTCTRQFCLDQGLDICKGAKLEKANEDTGTGLEGEVWAKCFERDSYKDQTIITMYLVVVIGLLVFAGLGPRVQGWYTEYQSMGPRRLYNAVSSAPWRRDRWM